jgi:hypothetical protein
MISIELNVSLRRAFFLLQFFFLALQLLFASRWFSKTHLFLILLIRQVFSLCQGIIIVWLLLNLRGLFACAQALFFLCLLRFFHFLRKLFWLWEHQFQLVYLEPFLVTLWVFRLLFLSLLLLFCVQHAILLLLMLFVCYSQLFSFQDPFLPSFFHPWC